MKAPQDLDAAASAHLRKSLRVLHQALSVSEKANHSEVVLHAVRTAIWQVHAALREVEGSPVLMALEGKAA